MINVHELRLGNKIMWADKINTVGLISDDGFIQCDPLSADRTVDEFEPIPLTPELLEKCGFKIDGDNVYYLDAFPEAFPSQRFVIEYKEDIGFMLRSRYQEYCAHFTFRHLQHLHQLQNLYFDLTAKELNITL
jgi:hypothetical protein